MNKNITVFQFFHWYSTADGQWWNYCASKAKELADKGITHVYLPPAYKSAFGSNEPGYAVYDLYDLGEFNQKDTVRTKYGTKDDYLNCIKAFHDNDIEVVADIVLNHRHGADAKEFFAAALVNTENRNDFVSEPHQIEGFTQFNFPGRNDKYSTFKWNHTTFSGIDGELNGQKVIYSIQNEYGAGWEEVTENENGNFDFLMGADVEFRNEAVREELFKWGKWYADTTGVDGFRMDAVKHMSPIFIKDWINQMKSYCNRYVFVVSEYWKNDVGALLNYLNIVEDATQLFDVPLHFNFYEASQKKNEYDLRTIFDGTLLQQRPEMSVTFVENHDTQPLQSLESTVDFWFKPLAYALILLREQGTPVVFYPCLYGANYTDEKEGQKHEINLAVVDELYALLNTRRDYAYGKQIDYFDHANVIGWVRQGTENVQKSGCAVVLSNGDDGFKEMDLGINNANKTYIDITKHIHEEVITNEHGIGVFRVRGCSVSVWIIKE